MRVDGSGTVGVAIATFQHERFIALAIESALHQTRPADVIVVADDCSADATATIAERYPQVRVLRSDRRLGIRANTARALGACNTDFVAFLDGDDVMRPQRLEHQLGAFSDPGVRVAFTLTQQIDTDGIAIDAPLGMPGIHHRVDWIREGMVAAHTSMMVRAPFTNQDERINGVADWKMVIDNLRDGSSVVLNEVLAEWRRHPGQATATRQAHNLRDHLAMCALLALDETLTPSERTALRRMRALRRIQLALIPSREDPDRRPGETLRLALQAFGADPPLLKRCALSLLRRSVRPDPDPRPDPN